MSIIHQVHDWLNFYLRWSFYCASFPVRILGLLSSRRKDLIKPISEYALRTRLKSAETYSEWKSIAVQIDALSNNISWKISSSSERYDHRLINSRLAILRSFKLQDMEALKYTIRSGLLRNLGGIIEKPLYSELVLGTKALIEDYIMQICTQIDTIADCTSETHMTLEDKKIFLRDIEQSYGRTAILLHGGASFGLYHLGVMKTLFENNLLPRIFCGTSIGALIAALICTHTDAELPSIFMSEGINLEAFRKATDIGYLSKNYPLAATVWRKIKRLLTERVLLDVNVIESCVKDNLKDITFEEAFVKTARVLNIIVESSRQTGMTMVLNHLTAPTVLIRSAAAASLAMGGIYMPVSLLAKDVNGVITEWVPTFIKYNYVPNSTTDTPQLRIAAMFGINFWILSEASPILAISSIINVSRPVLKLVNFVGHEVQHRIGQLARVINSNWMNTLFETPNYGRQIKIRPDLIYQDYLQLFSTPSHKSLAYWIKKGEKSTWPLLNIVNWSLLIENKIFEGAKLSNT